MSVSGNLPGLGQPGVESSARDADIFLVGDSYGQVSLQSLLEHEHEQERMGKKKEEVVNVAWRLQSVSLVSVFMGATVGGLLRNNGGNTQQG